MEITVDKSVVKAALLESQLTTVQTQNKLITSKNESLNRELKATRERIKMLERKLSKSDELAVSLDEKNRQMLVRLGKLEGSARKLSNTSRRLEAAEELIEAFIDRTGKIVRENVKIKRKLKEVSRRYGAAEDLLEAALEKLKSTKVETYVRFLIDHDGNFKGAKDILMKANSIEEVNELARRLKIESNFTVKPVSARNHSGSQTVTHQADLTKRLVEQVSSK